MPEITIDLIRKRAEHNEGLIHTLEELSLHQEELESINETLGSNCRRLKILYLQNNIIGKMKNLHHMKELEYLNLALNNISKVEGLHSCEFLNKLDLTVNFVDLDELESSIDALETCDHLRDLYMMGNPCQSGWPGFESYVIARLPQLERLDGKDLKKTDRIQALQRLPFLSKELTTLAKEVRRRKRVAGDVHGDSGPACAAPKQADAIGSGESPCGGGHPPAPEKDSSRKIGQDELTKHTPEVRTAMYREMAEQKKEKEDRQKENLPRDRDFELEQEEAVARAREREAEGIIRQCNEGKLAFRFEENRMKGMESVVLEVSVPRFLDSSLIDLDVHPHYVSIVIKGKVLRLSLQAEVKAGEARATRSKTTGSLLVTMPKVNPSECLGLLPPSSANPRAPAAAAERAAARKNARANDVGRTRRRGGSAAPAPSLAAIMMEEAKAAAKAVPAANGARRSEIDASASPSDTPREAVSIRGMVGPRHGGLEADGPLELTEVASLKRTVAASAVCKAEPIAQQAAPVSTATPSLPLPPPPHREHEDGHDLFAAGTATASNPPAAPLVEGFARDRGANEQGTEWKCRDLRHVSQDTAVASGRIEIDELD